MSRPDLPPNADEARPLVAVKIAMGGLRTDSPNVVFWSLGSGHPCAACERVIGDSSVEAECVFDAGDSLRFHLACFTEWQRQRTS